MTTHSGFIAVAGRPNAGKSTLLNRIAGGKVSIVSHRRQTTRSVIRLFTEHDNARIAWLDSPGWQTRHGGGFNRALNAAAEWVVQLADAIVFVTVAGTWTTADEGFLKKLPSDKRIICVVNKIDQLSDKNKLLPEIQSLSQRHDFHAIIPLSAKRGDGVAALQQECIAALPARDTLLVENETDYSFFFAELVREKLFRALGDELPYCIGVTADVTPVSAKQIDVTANIYVERDSQKPIVIGKNGSTLKRVGIAARRDMEKYSGKKIYLVSHVRIADWRRDVQLLNRMKIGLPPALDVQLPPDGEKQ